jgi:hypothetical protein
MNTKRNLRLNWRRKITDTYAIYKDLIAAGIKPKHAEAIARAIFIAHSARANGLLAVEKGKDREVVSDKWHSFIAIT